jgi:hypothetical protein
MPNLTTIAAFLENTCSALWEPYETYIVFMLGALTALICISYWKGLLKCLAVLALLFAIYHVYVFCRDNDINPWRDVKDLWSAIVQMVEDAIAKSRARKKDL